MPLKGAACGAVRLLLAYGADPNGVYEHKGGPLRVAADPGQKDILCLPLDRGANVEGRLAEALCAAARGSHKDLVETLLDLGPPVNRWLKFWAVLRSLPESWRKC
jgi:hypothetical protein